MADKLTVGIVWRAVALLAMAAAQPVQGQVSLCGDVTDEDGGAAQFVNVALFSAADTSAVLCGGVTDCDGHFALRAVRPGNYVVAISAVGYETSRQEVRLRMPSAGTSVRKAMVIRRANVKIDEVTASASRKSEAAGKSTYTFSQSQIRKSRHAGDLISGIDELMVDPRTERLALSTAKPGELKILINGVAATDEDLKAVPSAKVVRCEYYSLPPARYASVAAVVNVVTKPLDDGWACGADAASALSTGFVNASAYARFFRGNHQFGLDYLLSLRDYDDRRTATSYAFGLSDGDYAYHCEARDAFGYADNQVRLKYLYSTSDGTAFQAIFKPDFRRQWADGDASALLSLPREYLSASGFTHGRNKTFGPSLDLYLSRRVRGTDRLDVNVVGTYFGNRQSRLSFLSADTVSVVDDDMMQDTKKRSVIAEAAYVWQFTPLMSLSVGYKGVVARSVATISSVLSDGREYDYGSDSRSHYAYVDFSGTFRSASLRASLGVTNMGASNDRANYNETFFTPNVSASFPLGGGHTLQASFQGQATAPTISQLSDNATVEAPFVFRTGSPSLRAFTCNVVTLSYIFNGLHHGVALSAFAGDATGFITKSFARADFNSSQAVVISSANGDSERDWGGVLQFSIKPLGNETLQFQANAIAVRTRQKVDDVASYVRWYIPVRFSAEYKAERWGVSYQGSVADFNPSGPYLDSDEPQSHLTAYAQLGRVRVKAGCLWLLSEAKYKSRTVRNDILSYESTTSVRDNRNMLTIGLSVDLSGGKGRDEFKLKFHNADSDRGDF